MHPIQKPVAPERQRWRVEAPPLGEQTRVGAEVEVEALALRRMTRFEESAGRIAELEVFVTLAGYQRLSEQLHCLTVLASDSILPVGLRLDGRAHAGLKQTRLSHG